MNLKIIVNRTMTLSVIAFKRMTIGILTLILTIFNTTLNINDT
jgi:hypothetical protein